MGFNSTFKVLMFSSEKAIMRVFRGLLMVSSHATLFPLDRIEWRKFYRVYFHGISYWEFLRQLNDVSLVCLKLDKK